MWVAWKKDYAVASTWRKHWWLSPLKKTDRGSAGFGCVLSSTPRANHQGAVSRKHLDYYLDEFTFRFNRRRSKSRGKLFSAWRNKPSQSSPFRWIRSFTPRASPKPNYKL